MGTGMNSSVQNLWATSGPVGQGVNLKRNQSALGCISHLELLGRKPPEGTTLPGEHQGGMYGTWQINSLCLD